MGQKEYKVCYKEGNYIIIINIPDKCPFCHRFITPKIIYCCYEIFINAEVFFKCTNLDCQKTFIGYYEYSNSSQRYHFLNKVTFGSLIPRDFGDKIHSLSDNFTTIYNQAYFAEQHSLNEICGVGYRKALEFLIKDYLVKLMPDKEDEIKKEFLGNCITKYVSDNKIKIVAQRAIWLGNDETHYVRKWQDKDLSDLKKLIDLTLYWIEAEILSKEFEIEMP